MEGRDKIIIGSSQLKVEDGDSSVTGCVFQAMGCMWWFWEVCKIHGHEEVINDFLGS